MILIFFNDFLSQDKGLSTHNATAIVTTFGIGAACGSIVGGFIGQAMYNTRPRLLPIILGTSTIISTLPAYYLINTELHDSQIIFPCVIAFIFGMLSSPAGNNIRAILMNVNAPETRGSVFALFNLTDDLGKGFGPVLASGMNVQFGRTKSFNYAISCWLLSGCCIAMISCTLLEDYDRLQKKLQAAK